MAQHIIVVPYDRAWPRRFEQERALLAPVLVPIAVEIFHIGSTAVPGLAAKPIIDLMAVVTEVALVDARAAALERLGYEYLGGVGLKGRRYLRKGGDERTHQVHIFGVGDETNIMRHLALRDYLRTHPQACAQYAALKRELAALYPYSIDDYCSGKDALVRTLEAQALAWFAPEPYRRALTAQARAASGR